MRNIFKKSLFIIAGCLMAGSVMGETIFSFTITSTTTDVGTYTAVGGSAACTRAMAVGGSNEVTIGSQTFYKFNTSSAWTFTLDKALAEGDVITFTCACNTTKKGKGVIANDLTLTNDFTSGASNTLVYTVAKSDAFIGKNIISLKRADSDIKFGTIEITRESGGGDPTPSVAVTGVSLGKTVLDLKVGENETLVATVEPDNADNKEVTWSSDKESVATVDENGKVVAVAAGKAVITVATKDGGFTATCDVTVTEIPPVSVSGVSLGKTVLGLKVGENETLVATVTPDNAGNKGVTWSSDKESVATVDENGKVVAVAAGKAVITVTTKDGGFTATCEVTVTVPTNYPVVTSATWKDMVGEAVIDQNNMTITGQVAYSTDLSKLLLTDLNFEGENFVSFSWSDGAMDFSQGAMEITFSSQSGYPSSYWVTITKAPVSTDATLKTLKYGDQEVPGFAPDKYEYTIEVPFGQKSSPAVTAETTHPKAQVSVQQTFGVPDDVTIDVTAENGTSKQKYIVHYVSGKSNDATLKKITYNGTEIPGFYSSKTDYVVVYTCSETVPDVKAEANDANVKSVVVSPLAASEGTVTITVTAEDDTKKSYTVEFSCEHIPVAVTGVTLDKTVLNMELGGNQTLVATVAPNDADNKEVTWSSSKEAAATVDGNGKVTAVAEGEAVITVKTKDGGYTATCKVTVTKPAEPEPDVPETDLALHEPDIYELQEGYNTKLSEAGNRYYEVYYAGRYDNGGTKLTVHTKPIDKSHGITVNETANFCEAVDGWFRASGGDKGTGFAASEEFATATTRCHVMNNGQVYELHFKGYDQFSIYAADKKWTPNKMSDCKYFKIFIDDIERETTQSTDATIRRFDISAGEHVVRIEALGDGNLFGGFSLRETNSPRIRYVRGNDETQSLRVSESLKPVTYYLKNGKAPGAKTELLWEGSEATGIGLTYNTSGDTVRLAGTAACAAGQYEYAIVTTQDGKETSRVSGTFSVYTDIVALGETSADAYQNEEMDVIEFRYYAMDAASVILKWDNDKAPAGITGKGAADNKYVISGTTTAAAGVYTFSLSVEGGETVIYGSVEVISQDLGVDPILYLYQTKTPDRGYKKDGIYSYLKTKGLNLQARTAVKSLRSAEQYGKFKWILISEDVNADNEEVLAIIKGGANLPVLNLKGFTYTSDRLGWGEPDNGSLDTVRNNGCNIYVERADHPIFQHFNAKAGSKLRIFDEIEKDGHGVMPINIDLPGTLCLATAYTRNIDDYYQDGELQTVIHEIPASMRGGKKYICLPLSITSSKKLSADGKALLNAIVQYLTDDTQYQAASPALKINSFTVNDLAATITNNRIDLSFDQAKHPDWDIKALAPEIVLEDAMTHVVPASGDTVDFEYSLYRPVTYVVTDYINRHVYDVVIQVYNTQGVEEVYAEGDWVTIYDIYGRMVTTTNENIYTMDLPHGIYIAVTTDGQTLKMMR